MALLQAIGNDNGAGATTMTITFPTLTAGSLLRVGAGTSGSATIQSCSDTLNGAWTAASTGGQRVHEAYFKNSAASASPIVVTLTFTGSQDGSIIGTEDSGMDTTAPLDKIIAQNAQSGVTTWTTTTTGTLAQASEVGYAYAFSFAGGGQFPNSGLGSGWAVMTGTGLTNGSHDNPNGDSFITIRKVYAATTADTGSGACSAGTNPTSAIATYKVASGGGGGGVGGSSAMLGSAIMAC